ncbi:MAG TPA: flagellar basal body P-ring protein FlgI [Candidatus Binatia bacterium]|nr:flagellar basal body P-ring protein FlgI [Candidatus Binatia bacterium]
MTARAILVLTLALILPLPASSVGAAEARIKDIARVVGVRDNDLWGYGLVVGLDGTGDRRQSARFTMQALRNLLAREGITLPADALDRGALDPKNVAAVVVTAKLPPFATAGSRIDVVVSSIGDARSLQGGTLLPTPLRAGDGQTYAVASGPVSLGGGFAAQAGGSSVQKNHPTAGRIPGGATVERAVGTALSLERLSLALLAPDYATAVAVARAINTRWQAPIAVARDAGTVDVAIPLGSATSAAFIAELEALRVTPDAPAKVVINERTGTVVLGQNVRIGPVAVAHGNLAVRVEARVQVSQPPPLAPRSSTTVVVPEFQVQAQEQGGQVHLVPDGASIGDVVAALNALGATPRDLIAILQAIQRAGALDAELEVL